MIALTLSIIIPIFAVSVTAKKKGHTSSIPVYINDDMDGATWADHSSEPWLKGSGTEEDPYMIKDLVIKVNYYFAMMIENSSAYFKIMKCSFSNGGIEDGIEGQRTAGLVLANTKNGVIFKNRFIDNVGSGIDDVGVGIALLGTINNTIHKNIFSKNDIGIFIQWGMYTTIKQNDCKNNFISGIVIASAHKNIIEKNDLAENANAGIVLTNTGDSPKDNIIYKNNIENNLHGIILDDADINDILRNTIADNSFGILVVRGSEGNTVYHNNFIDTDIQAAEYQPPANNWHHPYMKEGNFWSDTSYGSDEYPFAEKNGWEVMTPIEEEILDPLLPNKLGGELDVIASETSYIRYGVLQLFSERMNGEAYPPYTVRINGTKVIDSVWNFEEETDYGEPGLKQIYYIIYPPDYFTLGYHEYRVEISWYNSGELIVKGWTADFTVI